MKERQINVYHVNKWALIAACAVITLAAVGPPIFKLAGITTGSWWLVMSPALGVIVPLAAAIVCIVGTSALDDIEERFDEESEEQS